MRHKEPFWWRLQVCKGARDRELMHTAVYRTARSQGKVLKGLPTLFTVVDERKVRLQDM